MTIWSPQSLESDHPIYNRNRRCSGARHPRGGAGGRQPASHAPPPGPRSRHHAGDGDPCLRRGHPARARGDGHGTGHVRALLSPRRAGPRRDRSGLERRLARASRSLDGICNAPSRCWSAPLSQARRWSGSPAGAAWMDAALIPGASNSAGNAHACGSLAAVTKPGATLSEFRDYTARRPPSACGNCDSSRCLSTARDRADALGRPQRPRTRAAAPPRSSTPCLSRRTPRHRMPKAPP